MFRWRRSDSGLSWWAATWSRCWQACRRRTGSGYYHPEAIIPRAW